MQLRSFDCNHILYLFEFKSLRTKEMLTFLDPLGYGNFSKNVEFEKLGVKTTLLGLEREICFQPNNS